MVYTYPREHYDFWRSELPEMELAWGVFGENFHAVFPYLVMIAVLIFRPYGLLGQEDVERV